jgi:hypothetical protein
MGYIIGYFLLNNERIIKFHLHIIFYLFLFVGEYSFGFFQKKKKKSNYQYSDFGMQTHTKNSFGTKTEQFSCSFQNSPMMMQ